MPDDTAQPIHGPHDKFFKETFGRPEVAREFFQTYLAPRLVEAIDWQTLKLEPTSFVDERLAGTSSDLLYSVLLRREPVLLYCLFEHQSTVDRDMPFRLLVYMVRIWEHWQKQAQPGEKPPCIVPIVLHQGGEPWTVSTRFFDWLAMPTGLQSELTRFQPDFEHALVDLSRMPLEQIGGELVLRLGLTLMKAAREDRLEAWLERFGPTLGELLSRPDRVGIFRALMRYALHVDAKMPSTVEEFVARVQDQTVKSDVMSIAEQLIERGERQGEQRGEQRGLAKGALLGRIQMCQEMLSLPLSSEVELRAKDLPELQALLRELEARLRQRMK
ncbi:MAG: Rpn family recombination-promoting nuclease/putative transposase [Verrucomicrobia bacterium]|nr:Rpn family recombination-promoting nuclease/putative transposase [Verrucomicrobiota bacterium]